MYSFFGGRWCEGFRNLNPPLEYCSLGDSGVQGKMEFGSRDLYLYLVSTVLSFPF